MMQEWDIGSKENGLFPEDDILIYILKKLSFQVLDVVEKQDSFSTV